MSGRRPESASQPLREPDQRAHRRREVVLYCGAHGRDDRGAHHRGLRHRRHDDRDADHVGPHRFPSALRAGPPETRSSSTGTPAAINLGGDMAERERGRLEDRPHRR